jgi:tetratricopeptide (TPR) repeat protein
MTRQSIAIALLLCLLGGVAGAADSREVARGAFAEGTRLYDIADFDGALAAFKKAYVHYEEPAFLFNIAQCYRQLHNQPEALRFYRTYLRKSPRAQNADEVRELIVTLEKPPPEDSAAKDELPKSSVAATSSERAPAHEAVGGEAAPLVQGAPSLVATAPTPPHRAAYKKWWFWTATIGGVAVAAAAVGLGLTLGQPRESALVVHAP